MSFLLFRVLRRHTHASTHTRAFVAKDFIKPCIFLIAVETNILLEIFIIGKFPCELNLHGKIIKASIDFKNIKEHYWISPVNPPNGNHKAESRSDTSANIDRS